MFCIAEEDTEADELKMDVKKFLYDLRMQADVIVVTMKSWEAHQEDNLAVGEIGRSDAMETFSKARKRIAERVAGFEPNMSSSSQPEDEKVDELQVRLLGFP